MLIAYRYRSVSNVFHEVYFVIECSAMTYPNQRAVAKLGLEKDTE